jgi:hypothetical protein
MNEHPTKRGGPLHWLTDRSRRFWVAIVVCTPVFYVAGFGPTCWIMSRDKVPGRRPPFFKPGESVPFIGPTYRPGPIIYKPLYYLAGHNRGPLGRALRSFVFYGMKRGDVPFFREDGIWWAVPDPNQMGQTTAVNPPTPTPDAPSESN